MAAGATYEPIATTTISGSTTTSVTFSALGSYTDLKFIFAGNGQTGMQLILQPNSDSSALYSQTLLEGNGTTSVSTKSTGNSKWFAPLQTYFSTGNNVALVMVDIFSYAGSTNKTMLYQSSNDKNGSGSVERGVGLYRSTSAITSLYVATDSGQYFSVGSKLTLYGIKAA